VKQFTLEYWTDDGWFVGRLKEMPAVMSQGETLEELQTMIRDAYRLMVEDAAESTAVPSERHEMLISLWRGESWCDVLLNMAATWNVTVQITIFTLIQRTGAWRLCRDTPRSRTRWRELSANSSAWNKLFSISGVPIPQWSENGWATWPEKPRGSGQALREQPRYNGASGVSDMAGKAAKGSGRVRREQPI
jgi:predicted RNase H-like HicB family nuclease